MGDYWNGKTESFIKIPAAVCYVLSNDKCMSYWRHSPSEGKINTCVVPCSSPEMARAVKEYVESRSEQKYIRVVYTMPRNKEHVIYSLVPGWVERAREYNFVRREYQNW